MSWWVFNRGLSLSRRGRKRTLTEDEETEVGSFVDGRVAAHQPTTLADMIKHITVAFEKKMSPSMVSKMLKRLGYRSHLTQTRPAKRDRYRIKAEIEDFRNQIKGMSFSCGSNAFVRC